MWNRPNAWSILYVSTFIRAIWEFCQHGNLTLSWRLLTYNSSVPPAGTVASYALLIPWRPFLALRALFLAHLGSRDVGEVGTTSLGTARNDHGFLVDQTDQRSPGHTADEHAPVDEVVSGQALKDLHEGHANHKAHAVRNMRCWLSLETRNVGVGGELDQVAQRKGGHDLQDGRQQTAGAAHPKLPEEGLVDGPDQRVLLAGFDAALEGCPHLVRQLVHGAVRVDAVDVVELECALVAAAHQRRNPLERQQAEEAGRVFRTHLPLARHWRGLAPSEGIWLLVPRLVLGQPARGGCAGHAGRGSSASQAVQLVPPLVVLSLYGDALCAPELFQGQLLLQLLLIQPLLVAGK